MNHELLKTYCRRPDIAAIQDTHEAALAVNALTVEVTTTFALPRRTVKSWLVEIGKLTTLLTAQTELAQTLAFILTDSDYQEIEVFDPLTQTLFSQCVSAGLFTQAEREQLEAKATLTTVHSVTEPDLLGRPTDFADIIRAREEIAAEDAEEEN